MVLTVRLHLSKLVSLSWHVTFYFINFLNNYRIIICIFPVLKMKVGAGDMAQFKSKYCSCQGLEFGSQQLWKMTYKHLEFYFWV